MNEYEIGIFKWISEAPFGEDTYIAMSLEMVRRIEEIGISIVSEISVTQNLAELKLRESAKTFGGKPIFINSVSDNEIRIYDSFGLQAVILLKPLSRDLKTPPPNVVKWPSPRINI